MFISEAQMMAQLKMQKLSGLQQTLLKIRIRSRSPLADARNRYTTISSAYYRLIESDDE